jgi:ubiquitin C-terminal hydrolase
MEVTIFQYKRIVKPPRLLCLHLNRLTYNNQGNVFMNKLHIKFNEHMDLNSNKVCSFETDMRYRLVSVIEHFGSQNKGHYIAAKMINQPIDKEH